MTDNTKIAAKLEGIERTLLVVAQSVSGVIKQVKLLQEEQAQIKAVLEKRHEAQTQDQLRLMSRLSHIVTDMEGMSSVITDVDETLAAIIRASGGSKQADKPAVKSTRVG